MNVPNFLTLSRFVMTVGFLYLFSINIIAASLLFVLAAITDFFDGYLARKYNLITSFGKIMDPIADKFLILSAFGIFAYSQIVPWWMFWVIAIREIGVTLFRFWAIAKGKVLAAEQTGKIKTVMQISTICLMLIFQMCFNHFGQWFFDASISLFLAVGVVVLLYLSVIITLLSGVSVVWNNRLIFCQENGK